MMKKISMMFVAIMLFFACSTIGIAQDNFILDVEYYPPSVESGNVAIMFFGGSEGGMPYHNVEPYTAQGYPCLKVGYFGTEHTPARLEMIPLEYFENAIGMFKSQPEVKGKKIVVISSSKGGELALLLASRYKQIEGVIAIVPSSVVGQGLGLSSSWSYKGQSVPFLPYPEMPDQNTILNGQWCESFKLWLTQTDVVEKAVIKVEQINGPVLILTGQEDLMWPSSKMGEMITKRLKDNKFPHWYKHYAYENAGHTFYEKSPMGGTPEGNKKAGIDSEQRIFAFLNRLSGADEQQNQSLQNSGLDTEAEESLSKKSTEPAIESEQNNKKKSSAVDGTWTATADGPDGNPLEATYEFEAIGKELFGTVSTRLGGGSFSEGKIDGDKISFVARYGETTIEWNGTVFGDEINFTQRNGERVKQFTAKRAVLPTLITFKDKIDVGGYKLNICCFGKGKPAVIVDAGKGEPAVESGSWTSVVSAIAPTTQVCLYDRAGLGLSDRTPEQDLSGRTAQDMVKDLHTLLEKADIPAPYILAGHSLGGYNVRLYASQYPKEVAGMVLVDSPHPDQWSKFSAALPPERPDESESLRAVRSMADRLDPKDPEKIDFATSGAQVQATGLLGDLPLVVITCASGTNFFSNLPTDLSDKLMRAWQDMQIDLAGLSSRSTHIIASHAGHYIQAEEPQLVIDAILNVIGQVKK